ncbi:alpha/beta hydrolase-fold protein [Conexibacter sp. DBS9H8]|uniref:alpha/beta hydrolase-fold protein n=1 Tax=Conexibacter sp. DBS9H8 TaxID=2937801 RepID=UPI00200FAE51|nr:alpha/beta hydrolase-fold protein [Conexibacter sp. DBS9H8]
MALTLADGPLGPPWQNPLHGGLDRLHVRSDALADNPLGDPLVRPLYVYRTAGVRSLTEDPGAPAVPAVFVLQAFLNQADRWFNRDVFTPTVFEALDSLSRDGALAPCVIVFVDAWTSLGGAQFINSPGVGNYADYLCDEVVPFIDAQYPVIDGPEGRGLAGHSSGGYGAMVNAMLRPDRFGAFSSRAGDALFEVSMAPDFPAAAKVLRDRFDGSMETFVAEFAAADRFEYRRFGLLLTLYAAAAAYSPGPDGRPELPFDPRTGQTLPDVFARWLAWDPVHLAARHADALAGLCHVHLEAGRADEANLDLGAQAMSDELTRLGVTHSFELFEGGHGGGAHRLPVAIAAMVRALASR